MSIGIWILFQQLFVTVQAYVPVTIVVCLDFWQSSYFCRLFNYVFYSRPIRPNHLGHQCLSHKFINYFSITLSIGVFFFTWIIRQNCSEIRTRYTHSSISKQFWQILNPYSTEVWWPLMAQVTHFSTKSCLLVKPLQVQGLLKWYIDYWLVQ